MKAGFEERRKRMRYVFPAVFRPEPEGGYMVLFPDIEEAVTQGDTIADCIEMAEDVLCLMLYERELNSMPVPAPSDIHRIKQCDGDIVTLIKCDTMDYRRFYLNRAVKKTLSIPEWLNIEATAKGYNFSSVLQEALKERLGISDK